MLLIGEKIPTLIAYDLMGTGTAWIPVDAKYENADMYNYAWTFNDFASNLFDIYKAHITGKVTIVGYGFGGLVAQAFALEHPTLIEQMYLITSPINPSVVERINEINYIVNWIDRNKTVSYLTFEQDYVNRHLCSWFESNNLLHCPYPGNINDTKDDVGSVAYLLAEKMYREGNIRSLLQTNKLTHSENLLEKWNKTPATFPIVALFANNDHYIDYISAEQDIRIISKSARVYIVNGKHGFPLVNTEYMYDLITGNDMSNNKLTLKGPTAATTTA